jgi:hypothetical protein
MDSKLRSNYKDVSLHDVFEELQKIREENKNNIDRMEKSQVANFKKVNDLLTIVQTDQANLIQQNLEVKENLEKLTKSHDDLDSAHKKTKQDVGQLSEIVKDLSSQVNNLKQFQLSQNLIFDGIPDGSKEDVTNHIITIAKKLNITVNINDMMDVYKFRTRKSILVKVVFRQKALRDSILLARKGKSLYTDECGITQSGRQQIYLREDLTPANRELLFHARKLKNYGFSSSWTVDGRILVKKLSTNKLIRITSIEQVDYLVQNYVVL